MKPENNIKRILESIICICLIFIIVCFEAAAETYFVDATNGKNTNSGTSENDAWKTLAKVNNTDFQPGDIILFKRGEIWREELKVPSSGASGLPIEFAAYGSGNKPVISGIDAVNGWQNTDSWSSPEINIWQMSLGQNPLRLLIDGTEYPRAEDPSKINADARWHWSDNTLSVYAKENPALAYNLIEHSAARDQAVYLFKKDFIVIRNLDLRGGNASLRLRGSDYGIIENCEIGLYAGKFGIWVEHADWGEDPDKDCNNVIIRHCIIDSGKRFSMPYYYERPYEGILLASANYMEILNNTVKNWLHAQIALRTTDPSYTVNYNKIYSNFITAPDVDYGRGFGVQAVWSGAVSYNEIHYNYIYNTGVRNQIGCDYNSFSYNIINTVTAKRTAYRSDAIAQGISIEVSSDPVTGWPQKHNRYANNVIYNTEEPGIRVTSWGHSGKQLAVENNEIVNNIVLNCGTSSRSNRNHIGLSVENDSNVYNNILKNNLVFTEGYDRVVYYRNFGTITIRTFNSKTGSNEDQIDANIQQDPLMVDPPKANFELKESSPCIDNGIDIGLDRDYEGAQVPKGQSVDIGAFEYDPPLMDMPPSPPKNLRIISSFQ